MTQHKIVIQEGKGNKQKKFFQSKEGRKQLINGKISGKNATPNI